MNEDGYKFSWEKYFPTMIFVMELDNPEQLNNRLLETIYSERERDRKGINRSNFSELGGWHSHNNLHKHEQYSELVSHIGVATRRISADLGLNKNYELRIGTMWSIINPPGSSNRAHIHPGCLLSGVYYIQAPDGAGDIEFIEPRTAHLMNQPKYLPNTKRRKECWTKVRYKPKAGKMLIFPAWLYHGVDPNMSRENGDSSNRIIISFNLNQRRI